VTHRLVFLARLKGIAVIMLASCVACVDADGPVPPGSEVSQWTRLHPDSLSYLSTPALRARPYGAQLVIEKQLGSATEENGYSRHFSSDGSKAYNSFVASYRSDGLRIYTRIDVPPTPPPAAGFPVVIFIHGWYGREGAPGYDFAYKADSLYSRAMDAYVDAGFLVLSPGLRGHGTVNGTAAEGIEFLDAWSNRTYLSTIYYAIDILNLLEGLDSLAQQSWSDWGYEDNEAVRLDLSRVHISAQSQGADSALTALAVSGEGSSLRNTLRSGSMWSGCFAPRFEQLEVYKPMAETPEAFMSGDGSWTGTAVGRDGSVNTNFVFGWPPDWIGSTDPEQWTWQSDTWSTPGVANVLQTYYSEAYEILNRQIADINGAKFELVTDASGKVSVRHDPDLHTAMKQIGGYDFAEYLTEPLLLHHSDQDYYALPRWNADLTSRANESGGQAWDFTYPGNTHSLLLSEHAWFSGADAVEGFDLMIARDIAQMGGRDPSAVKTVEQTGGIDSVPVNDLSLSGLKAFAGEVSPRFETVRHSESIDGMARRVVSFSVDKLQQFALVVEPTGEPPVAGWPVIIANHGHHPNPPDYGRRTADGVTDRPGDYYRDVPLAFARRGFMVVAPDFRGHNDSQGVEFTGGLLEAYWYSRDSIAAFRALSSLPRADTSRVFMWGHSMGGEVTLRSVLALGSELMGATIWSSVAAEPWQRALRSSPSEPGSDIDYGSPNPGTVALEKWLSSLSFEFEPWQGDATRFVRELEVPLLIHHAEHETAVPFSRSESLSKKLDGLDKTHWFYRYDGDEHMFRGQRFEQAVDRDAEIFNSIR
jgi:dienelactone hydrolase